jgi:hypothetical protein
MDPERALLGFDHALQLRRSKNGVPHELHDGDTVISGERIRASVQTSEDAYLYLAFCSHRELAVYPSRNGIRTRAGETLFAPELVLDSAPGREVLYVILSRTEIAVADPHLAAAIATTRPRNQPVDCGTNLDTKLAKSASQGGSTETPTPTSTKVLRGTEVRKKPISSIHARNGHEPPSPERANAPGPSSGSYVAPPANPPPDPDFERNPGNIVWYSVDGAPGLGEVVAADPDGIAVVRYGFTHVAPASPP